MQVCHSHTHPNLLVLTNASFQQRCACCLGTIRPDHSAAAAATSSKHVPGSCHMQQCCRTRLPRWSTHMLRSCPGEAKYSSCRRAKVSAAAGVTATQGPAAAVMAACSLTLHALACRGTHKGTHNTHTERRTTDTHRVMPTNKPQAQALSAEQTRTQSTNMRRSQTMHRPLIRSESDAECCPCSECYEPCTASSLSPW
jgi:hypothetical protein